MNLAIDGITALTISPLRIASYTSFLTFLSFIIYLLIILVKAIKGIYINNVNYIILTIIFFSALNMLFLGIIGEYLGRVFIETKGRPIYFVDEYNGIREDNK